ncbi:hypothetical protein WR25_24272 [Diploscapter pachys]|uniref:Carboxylic ester hydrolase n=1 Tax=Diploscapter pachys TaxID=2018661 RepID=A0A2A2LJ37_9BILA|nr:hypothetical protein WR25_24272 [Diploscapter pachys]
MVYDFLRILSLTFQVVSATTPFTIDRSRVPVDVSTRSGVFRGEESFHLSVRIRTFLSLPFAQPPLGRLRFLPPKPLHHFDGVFDTREPSPACYQVRDEYNRSFWGSEMWNANTQISENCLFMSIWAPADVVNVPVMVWLFGGGFYSGSPSLQLYDGKTLAAYSNVIVININYRLGPFGFLYLPPAVPGNMGLLDQQLALHWIKNNIAYFGGNPTRITLFGHSAGAASIVGHLIAPASKRVEEKSKQLARELGCYGDDNHQIVNCIRNLPPHFISAYIWHMDLEFIEFPFGIISRDVNFFRYKDAFTALRKQDFSNPDVNFLIGLNKDEGNSWGIYYLADYFDKIEHPVLTRENMTKATDIAFAALPSFIRRAAQFVYEDVGGKCVPNGVPSKYLAKQMSKMLGDYFFSCDSLWLADQIASQNRSNETTKQNKNNVFIYYFAQHSSLNPWPKWTESMHGYEIEFVFGAPLKNSSTGYRRREVILAKKMMQYWSSFASDGYPTLLNPKRTEVWPQFTNDNRRWMQLKSGSNTRSIMEMKRKECAVWRRAKDLQYDEYREFLAKILIRLKYHGPAKRDL